MSAALSESMDVAQVVLYAFWFFFFGLVYWLRLEDRREGYPTESDKLHQVNYEKSFLIPKPKSFLLPSGEVVLAPDFARDGREIAGERVSQASGAPLAPTGDKMISNMGPASYAQRRDTPELTVDGRPMIVPIRVEPEFNVNAGPDPRGWTVYGGDGKAAGEVKELWVDRADAVVRYLEVELTDNDGIRLLPITMLLLHRPDTVEVASIYAKHFKQVPALKNPDQITVLEEEKIQAFYAGGRMYADPKREEPFV